MRALLFGLYLQVNHTMSVGAQFTSDSQTNFQLWENMYRPAFILLHMKTIYFWIFFSF